MRNGNISSQDLRKLRRIASRWARSAAEADDLVQDALVVAVESARAFDSPQFYAWASAVIRRRALFVARTEGRRRRRDANFAVDAAYAMSPSDALSLPRAFVDSLSPSLQTVALLVNSGLGREEIASVLRISDMSLRQRISSLRKAWQKHGFEAGISDPPRRSRPPCGLQRRVLKGMVMTAPNARFAIADPDGHAILIGIAHISNGCGN